MTTKISIYWKNNSNDLIELLQYLNDCGVNAAPVPIEDYTGDGEELLVNSSDVGTILATAKEFNCEVTSV